MKKEQIILSAIAKAIKNEFDIKSINPNWSFYPENGMWDAHVSDDSKEENCRVDLMQCYYHIIFNHGFAKALWGEAEIFYQGDDLNRGILKNYLLRLAEMATSKNPLKYLSEHI